jgi:hypothetical protein
MNLEFLPPSSSRPSNIHVQFLYKLTKISTKPRIFCTLSCKGKQKVQSFSSWYADEQTARPARDSSIHFTTCNTPKQQCQKWLMAEANHPLIINWQSQLYQTFGFCQVAGFDSSSRHVYPLRPDYKQAEPSMT